MASVLYGDAEAAVTAIVRAAPAVAAFGPVTVTTDLIGYQAGKRWIRVIRTGGTPTLWMRLDNPTVAVDVIAAGKAQACDLAGAARAAVFAARGSYTGNGLLLYDVSDAAGLTWDPGETTGPARYTFTLALVTRPL